jgi:hypothetical protein
MSAPQVNPILVLKIRAEAKAMLVASGELELPKAVDELQNAAVALGLVQEIGQDEVQKIIIAALNGKQTIDGPPLALADWLKRDLPKPDLLLPWLSTTTRVLMFGPTGIGKTTFGIALGMRAAADQAFLHWSSTRKARVLLIDGEMSRRLLLERLAAEAERLKRLGVPPPEGMHVLSHEDIEDFAPLNTLQGQAQIEWQIARIGKLDLILFDNVSCLLAGNMKDTEQWAATMPWVKSLTRRSIGQFWLHHANEENKSYGDKTREWSMDTVLHMEAAERLDTDVSFLLRFEKARERTPANRAAFADIKIALVNDQWETEATERRARGKPPSPLGMKFFDALVNATTDSDAKKMFNCPTATIEEWRAECIKIGLLDKDKPKSASALFSKHKRELIAANKVACNETMAWLLN